MNIIITTPDKYPQKGGLSKFTSNIELAGQELGLKSTLFHWKSINEIKKHYFDKKNVDYILNVQFIGGYFLKKKNSIPYINFIHGSELFFTSKNIFKKIYKRLFKYKLQKYFNEAKYNVFVSQYSLELAKTNGYKIDYSRDLVFHNCIAIQNKFKKVEVTNNELRVICVARDVAHKNFDSIVRFLEHFSIKTGYKTSLFITSKRFNSNTIRINSISDVDDVERDLLYENSHFNMLCSKPDLKNGFVEGFGLTVLEAGQFGTPTLAMKQGGLCDSVHEYINGIFIGTNELNQYDKLEKLLKDKIKYEDLRRSTYEHTVNSHRLENFSKFLKTIL